MNVYIADNGDTLRTIAAMRGIGLETLMSLNPHLVRPDSDIAGKPVNLPDPAKSTSKQNAVPACPTTPANDQNSWIPLTPLGQMERTDYDVLIVGTGAGGGAVLWRLAQQLRESGKRIGIVERGGLLLQTHAYNIATMDNERRDALRNYVAEMPSGFMSPQVYALGGRMLFWNGTSPRQPSSVLADWPIPAKEMEFYYKVAEKVMSVTDSYTKGAWLTQIMLARLQKNGFPESIDEPLAVNLEPVNKYGVLNTNAFFSSIMFMAEALNGSYDLAVNARVVEVLTENNKAVGVKVMTRDKKSFYLKAKNVVLSASTFGTPQILLHSGIQGSAIGHYLVHHSRVNATGVVIRDEFPEVLGPLQILIPGTGQRPYQIQINGPGSYGWAQYQVQPLRKEWNFLLAASGKVESRFENRITLNPLRRDEYGMPEIQVDFSYSPLDDHIIEQMGEGIKQAAAAMNTRLLPRVGQSPVELKPLGEDNHESGTCSMGDDPATSATNRYGQIHGVQGLYVADNSVLPTSGTANPTLTMVALAIRTADYIAEQLK
ncbi:GMC oxidoreductase [Paenibacillus solisilvae]|uniref:GMC oxidoreductase n=1 Tax=Paenibacillus solisilvae TaxID=2486751 RepID=A0ABW0VUH8_9BACL